ncbi:hypothetical protein HRbin01_01272 [archaeon HR01]|nr:hypothetical protein HRbin01_01272 [archaeon HR01]
MRVRIVDEGADFLELEISEADVSLAVMLAEKANSMDGVEYLGYRVEHPLTGVITVTLKTRPGAEPPRTILRKIVDSLGQDLERLLVEVERL